MHVEALGLPPELLVQTNAVQVEDVPIIAAGVDNPHERVQAHKAVPDRSVRPAAQAHLLDEGVQALTVHTVTNRFIHSHQAKVQPKAEPNSCNHLIIPPGMRPQIHGGPIIIKDVDGL
jgi:hypothetical protein